LASSYVHNLLKNAPPAIEVTEEHKNEIKMLALLLARGRGVIRTEKREFENEAGQSMSYYEVAETQIEEPFRATLQLKTLALSLAYVHRRRKTSDHDLELLRRIVLSTMPVDRSSVLALFQNPANLTPGGTLTAKLCAQGINKSYGRAKQLLTELIHLEILEKSGDELQYEYSPNAEFRDLIMKPVSPLNHIDDLAHARGSFPWEKPGYIKHPPSRQAFIKHPPSRQALEPRFDDVDESPFDDDDDDDFLA
jgi:hypothetical protein